MTEIRRLPASRWKDYRRSRLEALKQSPLAFGSAFEEEAAFGEREWRKRMENVDFAMAGRLPLGMIVCSFNEEVKFRHITEIFGFYVKAGHRGKGVGTALLHHALWLAKDNRGIVKVRLKVSRRQSAALRMYKKAGFAVVGTLVREMKVGAKFYTMLAMEKRIR